MKFSNDIYETLQRFASRAGVSLRELCQRAEVPYTTVQSWKKTPPTAFSVYTRLKTEAEKITVQEGQMVEWKMVHVPSGRIEAEGTGIVEHINSEEGIYFVAGLKYPLSLRENCSFVRGFRVFLFNCFSL